MKKEELLKAYSTMRTIRTFEERCDKEFMQGNIPGFVHLYAGQEAVAVGVCSHLSDEDKEEIIKLGVESEKTILDIFGLSADRRPNFTIILTT